jgi:nicotinamide-nucleotide amidase
MSTPEIASAPPLDAVLRQVATPLAKAFVERCRSTHRTVATAESLTGGAIAAALAVIPGAGDVLKGGVVAYRAETKHDALGIRKGPVVTPGVAADMARAAISLFASDLAVAVTGVAGPDTEEGVPVGTVFLAVSDREYRVLNQEQRFRGEPSDVRVATVRAAISLLDWFSRGPADGGRHHQATSSQPS